MKRDPRHTMIHTYRVDEQHDAKVATETRDDGERVTRVTCDTASLSFVMSEALRFAATHGVRSMTVDGCPARWLRVEIERPQA